jgi:hypothetical protein
MRTGIETHFVASGSHIPARWDAHDSHWNRMAGRTRQADPFCSRSEWQLSYHEAFQPYRNLYLRSADDGLIAFAELEQRSDFGIFTPVEAHWLFGAPLLGPGAIDLLEAAMLELGSVHMGRLRPPAFVISGLRPNGAMLRDLTRRLGGFFHFRFHGEERLCGASLVGGLDGYLARRSANHRRKLRRQIKGARAKGVAFERHNPRCEGEVNAVFARMIAVELRSWKGINHCGMAENPARDFYRVLLARLARSGSARIMFARHGEQDIGFIFGAFTDGIYRGQQFSFDHAWQRDSIGNLLQIEQIRWLCEERARRYDMGPLMQYKHHWTERNYYNQTWVLAAR